MSCLHIADVVALQGSKLYGNANDVNGIFDDDRYDPARHDAAIGEILHLGKWDAREGERRERGGGGEGGGGKREEQEGGGIRDELARKSAPFFATIRSPSVARPPARLSHKLTAQGISGRFDAVLRVT